WRAARGEERGARRFFRAGLAREDDALTSFDRLDELFDDGILARREPKLVVGNRLGERLEVEAEEVEVQAHGSSSFLVAPRARSSSALAGSKGTPGRSACQRWRTLSRSPCRSATRSSPCSAQNRRTVEGETAPLDRRPSATSVVRIVGTETCGCSLRISSRMLRSSAVSSRPRPRSAAQRAGNGVIAVVTTASAPLMN